MRSIHRRDSVRVSAALAEPQTIPKGPTATGTDLAVHGQVELDRVAAELNRRPRQTLGWRNPAEKMVELLR